MMGHEIEAKLKYERHEDLKKALAAAGADFAGDVLQRDVYFDDAACSLKARGAALRLREEQRSDHPSESKVIVTFKGQFEKSQFKKRPESNIAVSERQAAEELLLGLGYLKVMTLEKKRSLWRLGGCEVSLDELPFIGRFVEIEGPDEHAVSEVQAALGLGRLEHISQSYTLLVQQEMQRRGADLAEVTFKREYT